MGIPLSHAESTVPFSLRSLAFPLALACVSTPADAATRVWPSSQCPTTLQACIVAVSDGDRIEIATNDEIDENLLIADIDIEVTTISGGRARLAPGRNIDLRISATRPGKTMRISRLQVRDGRVQFYHGGTGTATFEASDLDIEGSPGNLTATLRFTANPFNTVNATAYNTRITGEPAGINNGLLAFDTDGGTMNAYAAWNRIQRSSTTTTSGSGILADIEGTPGTSGGGTIRLFGNEVRGRFARGGIFLSEGIGSSTPVAFDATTVGNVIICGGVNAYGIGQAAGSGTINTSIVNNTIVDCARGITATRWNTGTSASRINGSVANNLIQTSTEGLTFTTDLTPALAADNNLIDAPANSATSGPNTIFASPRLVARVAPRLTAASPAINAADANALTIAILDAGMPALDADGLRRIKGARADIGAYEFGDRSFRHTSSARNTSGHITSLDDASTNDVSTARVLPTRIFANAVASTEPFGVYYQLPEWTIYNENVSVPIASGLAWSAWVPSAASGSFTHQGDSSNTTGASTRIDNVATNSLPDRIVLVAHNWTAAATYNPHHIGVTYTGSGSSGRWNILNLDQATLPATSGFNVYSQSASPNAFRVAAMAGSQTVTIDHPLINGVPCASPHATRVVAVPGSAPVSSFDFDYGESTGRWGIFSPVPYPIGTSFNVVIDPAQVFECRDRIFAHDFD